MPYMMEGNCVFKKNPDGSKGESMGCSDTEEMARQHMAALYAAEDEPEDDEEDEMEDSKGFNISFKQDASGQWWFIGIYSNKFKDRDGEILSEAAHKEYVQWLKETGIKPQVTLYHQPQKAGFWSSVMQAYDMGLIKTKVLNAVMRDFYKEYAIAETENVVYTNGFTVVIAKVHEDRYPQIKTMQNMKIKWGMSHGFVALNNHDNIFEKYRSFEFSVLSNSRAANWWTEAQFREVEMPLLEEDKKLLNQIQAGLADEVEQKTANQEAQLQEQGIEFKENVPEEVPAEQPATEEGTKEADPNALLEQLKVALNLEGLVEAVKAELAKRDETIVALENRLKVLEVDEDSKVASLYQPNWQKLFSAVNAVEPEKSLEDPNKEALKGWEDVKTHGLSWDGVFSK